MPCRSRIILPLSLALLASLSGQATAADADDEGGLDLNKPERLEWLQDAGFGMFIHWSVDSQIGSVISHSMAGASDDYLNWYIQELPRTFKPTRWDPDEVADFFESRLRVDAIAPEG